MQSTATANYHLAVVGRSPAGAPRTFRLEASTGTSREAAYRRLAASILGLDVASLASELRARRVADIQKAA
jgi:predicted nucleotidyltransferase